MAEPQSSAMALMAQFERERRARIMRGVTWVPTVFLGIVALIGVVACIVALITHAATMSGLEKDLASEKDRVISSKRDFDAAYDDALLQGLRVDPKLHSEGTRMLSQFVKDAAGVRENDEGKRLEELTAVKGVNVDAVRSEIPRGTFAQVDVRAVSQKGETVTFGVHFAIGDSPDSIHKRGYMSATLTKNTTLDALSIQGLKTTRAVFPQDGIPESYDVNKKEKSTP